LPQVGVILCMSWLTATNPAMDGKARICKVHTAMGDSGIPCRNLGPSQGHPRLSACDTTAPVAVCMSQMRTFQPMSGLVAARQIIPSMASTCDSTRSSCLPPTPVGLQADVCEHPLAARLHTPVPTGEQLATQVVTFPFPHGAAAGLPGQAGRALAHPAGLKPCVRCPARNPNLP